MRQQSKRIWRCGGRIAECAIQLRKNTTNMAAMGATSESQHPHADCRVQLQAEPLMKSQKGMATLMATSILLLLTGMWGWLSFKSVLAETTRSQHQLFAAQALSLSESLLETAMAYTENFYVQNGSAADAMFWRNAKPQDCPNNPSSNLTMNTWQCLNMSLTHLPLPDGVDSANAQIKLLRDLRNTPHKIILLSEVTLNNTQAGAGSRATVQQALLIPVNASGSAFNPALWPQGIQPMRVQRMAATWKNAGY